MVNELSLLSIAFDNSVTLWWRSLNVEVSWQQILLWICLTLASYWFSRWLHVKANHSPLIHPMTTTALILGAVLLAFNVDYQAYRHSVTWLEVLIGPATIALAMPLYKQSRVLMRLGWRVLVPIIAGGIIAPVLAWSTLYVLNSPFNVQMTMLVKSITTPLAMATTSVIGGIPELAAVFVVLTGIVAAACSPAVFTLLKIDSEYAQGLSLGTVGHVVGTSKAITTSEACGAFASLALCVNGIVTAIMLPILFSTPPS